MLQMRLKVPIYIIGFLARVEERYQKLSRLRVVGGRELVNIVRDGAKELCCMGAMKSTYWTSAATCGHWALDI
jgi:hypothetical protein